LSVEPRHPDPVSKFPKCEISQLVRRSLTSLSLLALAAPLLAGCGSTADYFNGNSEWFSQPARIFTPRSVSLDTGPLSPSGPVGPNDLVGPDGSCAPAANGSPDQPAPTGGYALGDTECDVVRAAGAPDNVAINGNDAARDVTLTYINGPRPGIYHFNAGRLKLVERAPQPAAPPKPVKPAKRATKLKPSAT
jgi:hypothetical protein